MSASTRIVLIANPAAGRGRAARLLPAVRAALARHGITDVRLSAEPGDERRVAREAARSGATTIIALGGDGTWGNVGRGILESQRDVRLALLAAGTGNDLAYATGVPAHDIEATVRLAIDGPDRRMDAGQVDGVHFLNVAGFGFDAEVLAATLQGRWLRGHAVYLVTAVRKLMAYRGLVAAADIDARDVRERAHYLALIVSNGPRFGGGFLIAPNARVDDGVLDLVAVRDTSTLRRFAVFAKLPAGKHVGEPEVRLSTLREGRFTFDAPPLFDADGELHQAARCEVIVRCLPQALRLVAPAR